MARRMTPRLEMPSGKKTYRATRKNPQQPWKIQMPWPVTKRYGPSWDDGCTRSLSLRPKNIRTQGRSTRKGLPENGWLESGDADTAWNTTAKKMTICKLLGGKTHKTDTCIKLLTQKRKSSVSIMPMSQGTQDPLYGC